MKFLALTFAVFSVSAWSYETNQDFYSPPKLRYPAATPETKYEVKSPELDQGVYKVQEKQEEDGRSTASDEPNTIQKWEFEGKMNDIEKKDLAP